MNNDQIFGLFPNSFHVFEFKNEYILFDRMTGLVCEVNEFAFDLFNLIEQKKSESIILDQFVAKYGDCSDGIHDVIETLKQKGFFKSILNWCSIEDISFESYWRHHPRRIQLMMAQSCNLKCGYCYAWRNNANDSETYMDWDTAKQSVDFLVRHSGWRRDIQVTFFGGEPLLNFPIVKKVVEYCREIEQKGQHHFCFELITNGTLLTHEITDYIADNEFLLFNSLDGWAEMHNYNRPSLDGRDLHETILQNALYANSVYEKRKLPKIKIRANLTNRFSDIRKVADYLESLGFTYIGIGAIEPLPHSDPCGMAFSEEQMDKMADTITEMMLEAIDLLKKNLPVGPYIQRAINKTVISVAIRSIPGVICGVCRNTAIVDNKGNIFPCHRYAGMEAYRMGNVFIGIEKDKVIDYYKKIASRAIKDCQDCWIRDFCAGGCPWSISDKSGNIHSVSLKTCSRLRRGVERGLWLRKELYKICPNLFDKKYQNMMQNWEWDDDPSEFL